ncbi:MAG TPA: hypothetical protein VG602_06130 [Actinomycetota bacterium]|nr:hypothetical protein [Actinomycetota bacterium]
MDRADVLAGRATTSQRRELVTDSIENAGGVAFQDPAAQAAAGDGSTAGGWLYPVMSVDLDGDGGDEVVLQQYSESDHQYLIAVNKQGALWRYQVPTYSYMYGALEGDLFAGPGRELAVLVDDWEQQVTVLAAVGAHGLKWELPLGRDYVEVNGLVEGDQDAQDEIAMTRWATPRSPRVRTIDGETGLIRSELRSTPEQLGLGSGYTQAFVTDGAVGGADLAVFVTPLMTGYTAEKRSLVDGSQVSFELFPVGQPHTLFQGPDFTGDSKRDARIAEWTPGVEDSFTYGVFDAASMGTVWTTTVHPTQTSFIYSYRPGNVDGSKGEDFCIFESDYTFDELETASATVRCLAGETGGELWKVSRAAIGFYAEIYENIFSDVDGDGLVDPIVEVFEYSCDDVDLINCDDRAETTAFSGSNGEPIWTLEGYESTGLWYDLTDANLDRRPGDDVLEPVYDPARPQGARFRVKRGLDLRTESWRGLVDTGTREGSVGWPIDPDLNGDGSSEVVVTANAMEGIGDPYHCEVWEGRQYCYYEEYRTYAYVAAFRADGRPLWRLEV